MTGPSPILYPNVTRAPGATDVQSEKLKKIREGVPGEFDQILSNIDLSQPKAPLKFSAHAMQRLNDRKIQLDESTLSRVSDAVDRAAAKGIEDSLVLTRDAALIVSVKNRTVVTAMDRESLSGNVFTNIDGAVIV